MLEVFARLAAAERNCLLSYAEFLLDRQVGDELTDTKPIPLPIPHERPPEERVIAAIKRLSNSYFMLDAGRMLHETAALMTAHMVQGRAAAEVINDLERLFQDHYQRLVAEQEAFRGKTKTAVAP